MSAKVEINQYETILVLLATPSTFNSHVSVENNSMISFLDAFTSAEALMSRSYGAFFRQSALGMILRRINIVLTREDPHTHKIVITI